VSNLFTLQTVSNDENQPIQPIFLMPKNENEQKPIYIPRNVYVPVVRPVFVPRERIIIRPQIIHVARPVLVDRPVPVQQRPIVIERDRPVPVRVETVEKFEDVVESVPVSAEPVVEAVIEQPKQENVVQEINSFPQYEYKEVKRDATYTGFTTTETYEFSSEEYSRYLEEEASRVGKGSSFNPDNYLAAAGVKSSNDGAVASILRDAAYVVNKSEANIQLASSAAFSSSIMNEEDQRRQEIQQLISEVEKTKWDLQQSKSSYTLEVLDPAVSDKFQVVDQNNLKSIYGIESYLYQPQEASAQESVRINQNQQH
jgi:hypothetical protein